MILYWQNPLVHLFLLFFINYEYLSVPAIAMGEDRYLKNFMQQRPMNSACLQLNTVSVRSVTSGELLLKNISFNVLTGEFLCINGKSGVGKTLTALTLLNLLPDNLNWEGGTITYFGKEFTPASKNEINFLRGETVSYVFQDPNAIFNPYVKVGVQVGDILSYKRINLSVKERRRKVESSFAELGLLPSEKFYDSYPNELSGGELQRCALSSTLLIDTKILIADEPTGSLDEDSKETVLEVLLRLNRSRQMTIIMITHDDLVSKKYGDRVILIKQDANGNKNNYDNYYQSSSKIEKVTLGDEALRVYNLSKSYPISNNFRKKANYTTVLRNVSFSLYKRECLGITGKSGCGKTTLAHCIVGLKDLDSGYVVIDGHRLPSKVRLQYVASLGVQFLWQHSSASLNPSLSVEDLIADPLYSFKKVSSRHARREAHRFIDLVELPENLYRRRPSELSLGQCQRVAIARALAVGPRLLIADEFISALDSESKISTLKLLSQLYNTLNFSMILISHEIPILAANCHRIIYMINGSILRTECQRTNS